MKHRHGRINLLLHPLFFTDFRANVDLAIIYRASPRLGIDGTKGRIRCKVAADQTGNHHENYDGDMFFCQGELEHREFLWPAK